MANIGETPANIIAHSLQVISHDGSEGVGVALREPSVTEDVWLNSGEPHVFEHRTREVFTPDPELTLIMIGTVTYTDEAGRAGVKRQIGFARDYDPIRGSYRKSEIYAEHEYRD